VTRNGFSNSGEIVSRQRDGSPLTGCLRPTVHEDRVIDDYFARRYGTAAVMNCWLICRGEEADRDSLGIHRATKDSRETLATTRNPEPGQVDLRQISAKVACCRDDYLKLRATDCSLVWIGIGELECPTSGHSSLLSTTLWSRAPLRVGC
jgi:hypothetical protein